MCFSLYSGPKHSVTTEIQYQIKAYTMYRRQRGLELVSGYADFTVLFLQHPVYNDINPHPLFFRLTTPRTFAPFITRKMKYKWNTNPRAFLHIHTRRWIPFFAIWGQYLIKISKKIIKKTRKRKNRSIWFS